MICGSEQANLLLDIMMKIRIAFTSPGRTLDVPEVFVGDRKYVDGKGFYRHLPDRSFTISAIW